MSDVLLKQKDDLEIKAQLIQRQWRSFKRRNFHESIFGVKPVLAEDLLLSDYVADPRIRKICYELISENAIVNNKVYHWTSKQNCKNIIKSTYLFGSKYLKNKLISFDKNALSSTDINNGDENVICLSPCLVDPAIFFERKDSRSIRKLMRLTIDIVKLDKPNSYGKYNQFFKLFDFCTSPFFYRIYISHNFYITCRSVISPERDEKEIEVTFNYNSLRYFANLSKKDAICYGNINGFNKFCLLAVFQLVDQAKSVNESSKHYYFKHQFYNYLATLSDHEVKKVLICLSQALSIFSEYNFNAALHLSDQAISEIYSIKNQKLLLLDRLTANEYKNVLYNIIRDMSVHNKKISQEYFFMIQKEDFDKYCPIYFSNAPVYESNMLDHLPKFFNKNYYETRELSKRAILQKNEEKHDKQQLTINHTFNSFFSTKCEDKKRDEEPHFFTAKIKPFYCLDSWTVEEIINWGYLHKQLKAETMDLVNSPTIFSTFNLDQWKALGRAIRVSGVKKVDMACNSLGFMTLTSWEYFCFGLQGIGKYITTLSLNSNDLDRLLPIGCLLKLNLVLKGITNLSIRFNYLDAFNDKQLDEFAIALQGVKALDLVGNHIDQFSPSKMEKLGELFRKSGVNFINIFHWELHRGIANERGVDPFATIQNALSTVWSDTDGMVFNKSFCSALNQSRVTRIRTVEYGNPFSSDSKDIKPLSYMQERRIREVIEENQFIESRKNFPN